MTRCPRCGAEGEYQYCMYCGTELKTPGPVQRTSEPPPVQETVRHRPVQTYAQQQPYPSGYQQPPGGQPYAGQPYPPPYAATYEEPEPEVGWWKLVLGVALLAVSLVICFGLVLGVIFIAWFVVDWFKWRQWSERRGAYRYS